MKLHNLVSYNYFKSLLYNQESNFMICNSFYPVTVYVGFVMYVVKVLFICICKLGCLPWPGHSWKIDFSLSESFSW